jgi:hypothetical protein
MSAFVRRPHCHSVYDLLDRKPMLDKKSGEIGTTKCVLVASAF